jgi:hypothetical protein
MGILNEIANFSSSPYILLDGSSTIQSATSQLRWKTPVYPIARGMANPVRPHPSENDLVVDSSSEYKNRHAGSRSPGTGIITTCLPYREMPMVRLLVGVAAFFWLGVVIAEVVRQSALLGFIGSPFFWGGVASLLFVATECMLAYIRRSDKQNATGTKRVDTAYHLFLGLICLLLLTAIPFLWWGVIRELARLPTR